MAFVTLLFEQRRGAEVGAEAALRKERRTAQEAGSCPAKSLSLPTQTR
jgi:hypothetical protein